MAGGTLAVSVAGGEKMKVRDGEEKNEGPGRREGKKVKVRDGERGRK